MGPTAGLVFAELGADVVKVEPAPQGDHTRGLGGFAAGFFAAFNRNKRSLALDLKRPEGQAAMHRLAATADVVIENYGPGTMERLGCGYETLRQDQPAPRLPGAQGLSRRPLRAPPGAGRGRAVPCRARLHDRAARPAAARRRLDHRHPGRRVRRRRGAGGAARARDDRQGPARRQRAVRERRLPDEHAHGRHGRDRPAGASRCRRGAAPGRSTRCSPRRRRAAVHRRHQRPAMDPLRRGVRVAGAGRRSAPRHQPDARSRSAPG